MSAPERAGDIRTVVIVGAGRWARVVATELARAALPDVAIRMHSRSHADSLCAWVQAQESGVAVSSGWPPPAAETGTTAVVVVNAAADHLVAARWAIGQGCPVLVEKPMAASAPHAQQIVMAAKEAGVLLAASNVFLFHPGIEEWCTRIGQAGPIASVQVCWTDPSVDFRHGGIKRHDPSLSVLQDWGPHIIPLLMQLAKAEAIVPREVAWRNGRDAVSVVAEAGGVMCQLHLDRKGESRLRRIGVVGRGGESHQLDYSGDPPVGTIRGEACQLPPAATAGEGPVLTMLRAFLASACEGAIDPRLDPELAVGACAFADACN